MLKQTQEGIANQVGGRFMACVQSKMAALKQLRFAQNVCAVFGRFALNQARQDILLGVARMPSAVGDQIAR